MSRGGSSRIGERLFAGCFSVLLGALALYCAARLIEAVAGTLLLLALVVAGVTSFVGLASVVLRRRRMDRW